MKVLKHLARDLNMEPHALRILLRKKYGRVEGGRWRWSPSRYQQLLKTLRRVK